MLKLSSAFVTIWLLLVNVVLAADIVSVSGKDFLLNDKPFRFHGVQLMTFVAPKDYLEDPPATACQGSKPPPCPFKAYIRASRAFGPDLLKKAKQFGANTILFKAAQPALDSNDPAYSPKYITDLTNGVSSARAAGFVVILGIQENNVSIRPGPRGSRTPIPNAGTSNAAAKLAELFKNDRGVVLELYNEPYAKGRVPLFWQYYIHGGKGFAGINEIIKRIRDTGSLNVILVEPLGQNFSRYPGGIHDPAGQLAFSVHTYFNMVGDTRESWDVHYGEFARSNPVVVTEWGDITRRRAQIGSARGLWCERTAIDKPLEAFRYFNEIGIDGVVGWAFDLPGTIVKDLKGTPTRLAGLKCGDRGGGIGELLQDYFKGTLPSMLN